MVKQVDSLKKCYIRACIGRGREVITELEKRGGNNVFGMSGEGLSSRIYYIGKSGYITWTEETDEIGYIILNSGWEEIKLKRPKRERMFLISVKEGKNGCKNCILNDKCSGEQERKCEIAALLKTDNELNGKTMAIMEVEPERIPFHVFEELKKIKPAN